MLVQVLPSTGKHIQLGAHHPSLVLSCSWWVLDQLEVPAATETEPED